MAVTSDCVPCRNYQLGVGTTGDGGNSGAWTEGSQGKACVCGGDEYGLSRMPHGLPRATCCWALI